MVLKYNAYFWQDLQPYKRVWICKFAFKENTERLYYWIKLKSGFNAEVLNFIAREFKVHTLPLWKRYVTLVLDEMKIREDIVFNKTTGEILGFVDYGQGSFDDRFTELRERCKKGSQISERTVATHMLALMVRGIFFKMDIPIAQFPTTGQS